MNKPLLSICLPTYNRANYLEEALESIKIQVLSDDDLNKIVEVVISDNCSKDETSKIADKYKNFFVNFKYIQNEKNIGFDLNVVNVVKNATGAYCWYLGDDDVIINGAVKFVCECLKNKKYDVVGIEGVPMPVRNDKYKIKKEIGKDSLLDVVSYNDFYFSGYLQGGFSFMIFDRDLWLSCLNVNDYLEHWLYYEVPAKMLVQTKKMMLYIKDPLIMTGQDCRWVENGTELFEFVNSNLLRSRFIEFGFDKSRLLIDLAKNKRRILIMLLRAKGHGLKCNFTNLKLIYRNFSDINYLYLFFTFVIYFVPNKIVVLIRDLKKRILEIV